MLLEIITPESKLFRGEITSIKLPGMDGEFEILKDSYNFDKEKSGGANRETPLDNYSRLVYAGQDISDDEKYTFYFAGKI